MNSENDSNSGVMKKIVTFSVIAAAIYYAIGVAGHFFAFASVISSNPILMIIIGIVIFVLSIILGVYLIRIVNKNRSSDIESRMLSRWFVISFLFISVFNIVITSYLIGTTGKKPSYSPNGKIRIVLLLPLNESLKSAYDDGIRQITGFAEFLKDNPECTRQFEFALYDHSMKVDNAERIVRQEILEGTQYFISTMSSVNLGLSQRFDEIVNSMNVNANLKPKLICAVTSAPTIKITDESVYRFYIRSQEEATELATIGSIKGINSVVYIAVDDDYGKGAVKEFKEKWKGEPIICGLLVGKTLSVEAIENQIKEKILPIPVERRKGIFICHYGNGIDNIITAISNLNIKATLFATSTISIYDWQKPIKTILDSAEWYTCIPDYTSLEEGQNDVIKNFTVYTLYRLTEAILRTKQNENFSENWKNAKYPDNLDIKWDGIDAIIPMRAVYKSEVNNPR